ncbi:MAG TPA: TPM domain-containing protein [Thermoanaerobaculia bacterium]|nr:TPM domain-containing protein [Thermoanaerobaculia bacterium]
MRPRSTVFCAKRAALCLFVAIAALAIAALARAEAPVLPKPASYVTDLAGVFDPARASALNERLAAFERDTSNQIVVYVDRKVPETTTLEELANKSFHAWGVGQKGKSNGAVLFVFVDDKKMRIEVGYGLEGAIPDAIAHRITNEVIKPSFKAGDYATGVEAGADALIAAAKGEPFKGTGKTAAESGRNVHVLPGWIGLIVLVLFLGIPAALIVLAIKMRQRTTTVRPSGWSSAGSGWSSSSSSDGGWSSSSSSSSDSSSSSSSDFSGGGGDSGGGGSSDSW